MFLFGNIIAAAISLHSLMMIIISIIIIIIIYTFRLKINNDVNIPTYTVK